MKLPLLLSAASMATAFVIPDQQVLSQFKQWKLNPDGAVLNLLPGIAGLLGDAEDFMSYAAEVSKHIHWQIGGMIPGTGSRKMMVEHALCGGDIECPNDLDDEYTIQKDHHPHKPKPEDPHPGKPNLTIYEMITASNHTTIFAKLVSEFDDIVEKLNSTSANYTLFVPTDEAFAKFKHRPKPPKKYLKKFVKYHISTQLYPARKIFFSRTIPTLLKQHELGSYPQRISTQFGWRGLSLNFIARIVKSNLFATNGVVHGLDHVLFPPFMESDTLNFLSEAFSTFEFGLTKTGLFDVINDTSTHVGGTFFAPSNGAFRKLGPKVNGFLFSRWGEKYLKALLQYHIVFDHTLYSDAYNEPKDSGMARRSTHIDLPTLLDNHHLSIDISRFTRVVIMKVNGFVTVAVPDIIVRDGVMHVINDVLIPPRKPHKGKDPSDEGSLPLFAQEDAVSVLTIDELVARLEPLVEKHGELENEW